MEDAAREALIGAVVVARNEAATLGLCLSALRRALDRVGGGEILVVDSASTDLTARVAVESGCRVVIVRKASRICPSAMRRIGASRMACRYLLFVDGDCELETEFVPLALAAMEVDPSLGVAAGLRRDFYRTRGGLAPAEGDYYDARVPAAEVPAYGGCALYRRRALEGAGSFDPFLRAKEEEDLAQRIRAAGYRIEILQVPMIRHITVPRESLRRLVRSLRHGFYLGRGQAARTFLSRGQAKAAFKGLDRVVLTLLHLVVGAICLGVWSRGPRWPALAWLAISAGAFGVFVWRSRSLTKPCYYVLEWLVQGICLLAGLVASRPSADSYRWEGEERAPSCQGRGSLPRVLLVAPRPAPPFRGGVEKGVDLLLHAEIARQTSLRLFNTHRAHDPSRSVLSRLIYQAGMVRAFLKEIRGAPVEVVHVKTSSGINFHQNALYVLLARWSGYPVLLQIHSGRLEAFYDASVAPLRVWIRHALSSACRVAVLSRSWEARVRRIAPEAQTRVVPNGLGEDELARLAGGGDIRRQQIVFLGTGREDLNRDKGLDDLLAVLPALKRKHPQSRWVLAGLQAPEVTSASLSGSGIDRLQAGGEVRCLGPLDPEEKITILRESTILALPSYYENMPNLLLEGMAAGLGIVATDVGAIPEMLGDGEGGLLIPPGDRQALSEALDRLLDSPGLAREQGKRNRATVARDYTMEAVQRQLGAVYREVAGWLETGAARSSAGEESAASKPLAVCSPARPAAGP